MMMLLLAGCGLPDYEKRMDEQRARIAKFDEMNRQLDAPIEMPSVQPKNEKEPPQPAWPFEVYLRLPTGLGTKQKDKVFSMKTFPLVRYAGETGMAAFVAAGFIQESKKSDVAAERKFTTETFRRETRVALQIKYDVAFSEKQRLSPYEAPIFSAYPDSTTNLMFKHLQYSNLAGGPKIGNFALELYFFEDEEAGKQIAIAFQRPARLTDPDAHRRLIDSSLGTLDISNEAPSKRASFRRPR